MTTGVQFNVLIDGRANRGEGRTRVLHGNSIIRAGFFFFYFFLNSLRWFFAADRAGDGRRSGGACEDDGGDGDGDGGGSPGHRVGNPGQ